MGITDKVRQQEILEYISLHRKASVHELVEQFGVSAATIRRDLLRLQRLGHLVKTYGGAVSSERTGLESSFNEKMSRNAAEKDAIGKLAAGLVDEGDTIIIDSGTTALRVAANLNPAKSITVVTNSLGVIEELGRHSDITVFILCGQYRPRTLDVAGPTAVNSISTFNVDKGFLAIDGLDFRSGLTSSDVFAAEMCRAMMRASRRAYIVADSSKVGHRGFAQIAPLSEVDALITDTGLSPEHRERLESLDLTVKLAQA
jgi:DeoR/GlpR family transcriptional regulator of sugar metabolism